MRHGTCSDELWHKKQWVMAHVKTIHVTQDKSCHTHEWVTSHAWMSHATHMNDSCHIDEWGTWWDTISLHGGGGKGSNFLSHTFWKALFIWNMTRSFIWDMTHSYGTWLIHMGHGSFVWHMSHFLGDAIWKALFKWDMTHSFIWDRLIHMGHLSFPLQCGVEGPVHMGHTAFICMWKSHVTCEWVTSCMNGAKLHTDWRRPTEWMIFEVLFRKWATNYSALLRRMTYIMHGWGKAAHILTNMCVCPIEWLIFGRRPIQWLIFGVIFHKWATGLFCKKWHASCMIGASRTHVGDNLSMAIDAYRWIILGVSFRKWATNYRALLKTWQHKTWYMVHNTWELHLCQTVPLRHVVLHVVLLVVLQSITYGMS